MKPWIEWLLILILFMYIILSFIDFAAHCFAGRCH